MENEDAQPLFARSNPQNVSFGFLSEDEDEPQFEHMPF